MSTPTADVGVIGGSGFYSVLDEARTVSVETPFGPPSDDLVIGTVAGRQVAFLARHGRRHRFPPHWVNYRAPRCSSRSESLWHPAAGWIAELPAAETADPADCPCRRALVGQQLPFELS